VNKHAGIQIEEEEFAALIKRIIELKVYMEFAEPKIDSSIETNLLRKFDKNNDLCIDGFVAEDDTIAEIISSPTRNGKVF
jgi:hypothetical protein